MACQVFKRLLAPLVWALYTDLMAHREFKQKIYAEFARIGNALGSARRLELLDLLAQGPRHVDALATETEMSVANVSQHLQVLRQARLVEAERVPPSGFGEPESGSRASKCPRSWRGPVAGLAGAPNPYGGLEEDGNRL